MQTMPQINFNPFPTLTTKRLVLRKLDLNDATEIFALRSDERVNKYIDRPKTVTLEEAQAFIQKILTGIASNEWVYWAITLKDNPKLVGTICLWNISTENSVAETGYELHPDWQGKGIMQEALSCVLDFGFSVMKLKTIEAYTHAKNNSSSSLLEKFDFKRTGTPTEKNEVVYLLTNSHHKN